MKISIELTTSESLLVLEGLRKIINDEEADEIDRALALGTREKIRAKVEKHFADIGDCE